MSTSSGCSLSAPWRISRAISVRTCDCVSQEQSRAATASVISFSTSGASAGRNSHGGTCASAAKAAIRTGSCSLRSRFSEPSISANASRSRLTAAARTRTR